MKTFKAIYRFIVIFIFISISFSNLNLSYVYGDIAATHIYHNHMPNFWPYYDVSKYTQLSVGSPIRYIYDGQVINLKNNPPDNYTFFLPHNGGPMPHDDLVTYYSHHAKRGAYLSWPMDTAKGNQRYPFSQTQVTMSAALITNINSFAMLDNLAGYENNEWGRYWREVYFGVRTPHGFPALDLVHFTGHHSMGPLVGNNYFLKDLIYHNVTLSRDFFLGDKFKSSKGFFPTELGFSERLIPVLKKLDIKWSVLGNVHYSRALRDYPYLNDPGIDCLISPPNKADMQNKDPYGGQWVARKMFNEQQTTYNKFPFASIPHWVRYVNPETGEDYHLIGIPVEQAGSWEEGYQGSVTGGFLKEFEGNAQDRMQFFVIAHDGDNSSGRAGDGGTWANSGNITYAEDGVDGIGVDEYLQAFPVPEDDIVHVQDGSWIDTRDSSSDPTWYHWHLPMGIWKGQFADFNRVNGTNYEPKKNLNGQPEGMTVSFEYGYHYLERNFALLQASENYAQTAEQIWLDEHPNYWHPTTPLDFEIVGKNNTENQLNPYMFSYPLKGDENNDYKEGANPAELAWYFLIASIDSGFGYYDENVDDGVKPTISFNQSLYFSKPYVETNKAKDRTGPSVWWPQRYPYNPGSTNVSKSEGWTLHYFDNTFGIYTYAFDVSGIKNINVKIRTHEDKWVDPKDNTWRVYDPKTLKDQGIPHIDPDNVSSWVEYPMKKRDLKTVINGVDWQPSSKEIMEIVPAQEIGDLYYAYIKNFRDQLLDFYIEAEDEKGNVTKSVIQQVYVGAGKYEKQGNKIVENVNGSIQGTYPFVTDSEPKPPARNIHLYVESEPDKEVTLQYTINDTDWSDPLIMEALTNAPRYKEIHFIFYAKNDNVTVRYSENNRTTWKPSEAGIKLNSGTFTIFKDGTHEENSPPDVTFKAAIYYKKGFDTPFIHWRPLEGKWTNPPGEPMDEAEFNGYSKKELNLGTVETAEVVFNNGKGQWDNNGGQNYFFPSGVSTFENATIREGKPAAAERDYNYIVYYGKVYDATDLSLYYKPDKEGQYVLASGASSQQEAFFTFEFTSKTSPTEIQVQKGSHVIALDAPIEEGTWTVYESGKIEKGLPKPLKKFTYTIYFESDWPQALILYKKDINYDDSPWIGPVDMTQSDINGYFIINYEALSSPTEIAFIDGLTLRVPASGNIKIPSQTWTVLKDGSVKEGQPSHETEKLLTLYYKGNFLAPNAHYRIEGGQWTRPPGVAMKDSQFTDYKEITINMGKATRGEVVFNDGRGTWDNNNNKNYSFEYNDTEAVTIDHGIVLKGEPKPVDVNKLVLYYKGTFDTPYAHYRVKNGQWTSVPGIPMKVSDFPDYKKVEINLGASNNVEVAFNDGKGNWDSNGGQNYHFEYNVTGAATFSYGNITPGEPQIITKNLTIYYKQGLATPFIHYRLDGGAWTKVPGIPMEDSEYNGYKKITINMEDAITVEAVFNDGQNNWDNNSGKNYKFTYNDQGAVTFDSGRITPGKP
jgi:hypothetical protein